MSGVFRQVHGSRRRRVEPIVLVGDGVSDVSRSLLLGNTPSVFGEGITQDRFHFDTAVGNVRYKNPNNSLFVYVLQFVVNEFINMRFNSKSVEETFSAGAA